MRYISDHPFINDLKKLHITTLGAIVLVLLVLVSLQVTLSQTQKRQDQQQSAAELIPSPTTSPFNTYCRRDADCSPSFMCTANNTCVSKPTPTIYTYCRRNSDCPTNYACNTTNNSCYVNVTPPVTPTPTPNIFCTSNSQCPTNYFCSYGTCVTVPTVTPPLSIYCRSNTDCPASYACNTTNNVCYVKPTVTPIPTTFAIPRFCPKTITEAQSSIGNPTFDGITRWSMAGTPPTSALLFNGTGYGPYTTATLAFIVPTGGTVVDFISGKTFQAGAQVSSSNFRITCQ